MNMTLITWTAVFPCVLVPVGLIFRLLALGHGGKIQQSTGRHGHDEPVSGDSVGGDLVRA